MLTAKDTELDKVLGLELGADDYVTKPFLPVRLWQVKAQLRRQARNEEIGEKYSSVRTWWLIPAGW